MSKEIKKVLLELARKKHKDRAVCLKKADDTVISDIRSICSTACHHPKLKNSKKLKKYNNKIKNIIRRIAKTKSLKKIKKILLASNLKFGKGVFTLLGSVLVPLLGSLIAKHV